ncbi:MAG: Fic family protein [Thermodesulfobacteriota bacterium]
MTGLPWQPIDDLPADWRNLASPELASLGAIWIEQAARLAQSDAVRRFNERLRREWAIETGVIENLYSIDRGVTQILIERGIEASLIPHGATDKPVDAVVSIVKDQEEALEGLFDFVAQRRSLSTSYIKQLHQVFTRHQETSRVRDALGRIVDVALYRGDWKRHPNNPLRPNGTCHEYCPPEHVAAEMDRLLAMHLAHQSRDVPPEVEAAWLHHRFTQIHPFQDGNGRLARALASLVFLRARWFPLVINRDRRASYIEALEEADRGSLSSLVDLFAEIEKRGFLTALSLSEEMLRQQEPLRHVVKAAMERLESRQLARGEEKRGVFAQAARLQEVAHRRLQETAGALSADLERINPGYRATADASSADTEHWFRKQAIELARQFNYYADLRTFRAWVRLKIQEERRAELVILFHALGVEFLGIIVAAAFIEYRDRNEDGETTLEGPHGVCRDVFQFSYQEPEATVGPRFQRWLDDVLLLGLDQWRRQL